MRLSRIHRHYLRRWATLRRCYHSFVEVIKVDNSIIYSPVDEMEKLIELAIECGIEKNEKLFFYASNIIFGPPKEPTDTLSKLMPVVSAITSALKKEGE